MSTDFAQLSTCWSQGTWVTLYEVVECEVLASRLERLAEWQVGLRPADRADLRRAATIVRNSTDEPQPALTVVDRPTVIPD